MDAITTNKTDFFREPQHFDFLTGTALPRMDSGGATVRITLWSAGCSSGEEPYTLAMVLSKYAAGRRGLDFQILATDVSTRVLEAARSGIYTEAQVEPVPEEFRRKYLLRSNSGSEKLVRIVPELRKKVSFHRLNFMDAEYPVKDQFDAIFFRNVMIYFDKSTQEQVIARLCRSLKRGGYLFVGHSESLAGLDVPVELVRPSVFRMMRDV
jgi:chemotaxis protein methyltransferase CheR